VKATELRVKSLEELTSVLSELRKQQFKTRLLKASGELSKTHQMRTVRRTIARIETILTEKQQVTV
jgi:large subunit ribosomal protein L29